MPLPHNHLWIRQPELLVPMRKPRGLLRYNPASIIRKDVLLPFDSWQQVGNGEFTPMGRNIGLRQDVQFAVSMNHAGPYEHWFPDDLGVKNEYGGTYADAEVFLSGAGGDIMYCYGSNVWAGGASWTCHRDDISGSEISYILIGTSAGAIVGHAPAADTIKIDSATSIVVWAGSREVLFSGLPDLLVPGKTYSVVAKAWKDASNYSRAKLWLNGVFYGESVSATTGANYPNDYLNAVTAGAIHHNRVLDGIVHMVWASSYHPPDDICLQESFDPFQTVLPA